MKRNSKIRYYLSVGWRSIFHFHHMKRTRNKSYRLDFFLRGLLGVSGSPIAASTTERASRFGSVEFLLDDFFLGLAIGFVLGVRFVVVRLLGFTRAFLKDSSVPFMPA